MLKKRLVILILLILNSSVFAMNSDFNNDGKVDVENNNAYLITTSGRLYTCFIDRVGVV